MQPINGVDDADDFSAYDVKDGYLQADRSYTNFGWLATFEPMYDDDGEKLCYQLGAPMCGDDTVGRRAEAKLGRFELVYDPTRPAVPWDPLATATGAV